MQTGARLRIVVLWHVPVVVAAPCPVPYDWQAEAERHRLDAERLAAEALAVVVAPAEPVVREGDPSLELRRLSREVDLIVIGSRGWGTVRRVLSNSTAHTLVHRAQCPVLVLPRGAHVDIDEPVGSSVTAALLGQSRA